MSLTIEVTTNYEDGDYYTTFRLGQFNKKITNFLKSIGFTRYKDIFTYRVKTYQTTKAGDLGEVRVIDVAYFQLKKAIKADKNTHFTNYTKVRNSFSIKDGVVTLQYDNAAAAQIVSVNSFVDASAVRYALFDLGFTYSNDDKTYSAPVTTMLLSKLESMGFVRYLGLDDSAYKSMIVDYTIVEEKRTSLMKEYRDALKHFIKHYDGEFELLPHQLELMQNLDSWGFINAFDMGCGKTFTSLYLAAVFKTIMPLEVVVVCPKSVMQNWTETAAEHFGMAIHVSSWSSLPKPPSKDYIVIYDECHYMQDSGNARSHNAVILASKAISVMCLSGTATRNGRAKELFTTLKCIGRKEALLESVYTREYGWADNADAGELSKLAFDLKGVYFYAHKDQVLDLPGKERIKCRVRLSKEFFKLYEDKFSEFMKTYYDRVRDGVIIGSSFTEQLVALQGLRMALAKAKVGNTVAKAVELAKAGHQSVIFSDFNEPLDLIEDMLYEESITYHRIVSDDSAKERKQKQNEFKAGAVRVMLCSYKVGGVGIDLTPCKYMIFNDRPYTPGDALQAEDRCNRIGQKEKLTVYWMWWNDPEEVEQRIADILTTKQGGINDLNQYNVSLGFANVIDL